MLCKDPRLDIYLNRCDTILFNFFKYNPQEYDYIDSLLKKYDNLNYLIIDIFKNCSKFLTINILELVFKRAMELNINLDDFKLIKLYDGDDFEIFEYLIYYNPSFNFCDIKNYDFHKIALD